MPVAAGVTYNKMIQLPVDTHIVRVSCWGDAAGADDLLSVHAARTLRDS
jgi:endonuclease III